MAFSTQIVTDLGTVATNGPSTTTLSNSYGPGGLSATGGSGNMTGGSGNYASGTFYSGIIDYPGSVQLAITKAKELAVLLIKLIVLTDQSTDSANQALIMKCLNDLQ